MHDNHPNSGTNNKSTQDTKTTMCVLFFYHKIMKWNKQIQSILETESTILENGIFCLRLSS